MFLQRKPIDYTLLGEACNFYKELGYKQIETPWMVTPEVSASTFQGDNNYAYELKNDLVLVCSAEQGFIQMFNEDKLKPNKKYFSVSPCFRGEKQDTTHSNWFMKLELCVFSQCAAEYGCFVSDAMELFDVMGHVTVRSVSGGDCIDLMAGDLELGSYGSRKLGEGMYINYGTGLALPRFTLAQERNG